MKGKNPNRRGKSKIEKSLAQDDDFSGSAAWEVGKLSPDVLSVDVNIHNLQVEVT